MTRVLLVDDNADMRYVLRAQIESMGYSAIAAQGGKEAIGIATSENPDLILMDIMMPEMDGWETTRILRANPATQNIPILAITALFQRSHLQTCIDVGCNDYLVKPFTWEELRGRIKTLIDQSVKGVA